MTELKLLQPGDVIQGKYRIDGVLAKGGYGVVYEAHQLGVERPAVVKTLLPSVALEDTAFARFEREAQIASRLRHPNTVTVFDFGKTDGNLLYMVMERLEGMPLDKVLRADGAMRPERVRRILLQTLEALAEAHSLGVVHRDLKPSNIFLCEVYGKSDYVKVIDFGIAKVKADFSEQKGVTLTESGFVVGTPGYLSPELLAGRPAGPQADLYSIGIVGYELLTGRTAFPGTTPLEKITRQATEDPATPAEVITSLPLWPIITRMLAREPAERYATAEDVIAELQRLGPITADGAVGTSAAFDAEVSLSGRPMPIPRAQTPVSTELRPPRRWLPAIAVLGLLVVATGVVLGLWLASSPAGSADTVSTEPAGEETAVDTVSVTIDSVPGGARVYAHSVLIGTTPLVWQTNRSTEPVALEFTLPQHVVTSRLVVPEADARLQVTLQPAPPADPVAADAADSGTEPPPSGPAIAPAEGGRRRTRAAARATHNRPARGDAKDVYDRAGIGKKN